MIAITRVSVSRANRMYRVIKSAYNFCHFGVVKNLG